MIDPIIELPDARRIPLSTIETDTASRARYLARFVGNTGDVLCLCRFDGIPMGVAHRESPKATYYLYRLHRSDPLRHAPGCPHHFTPSVNDTEGVPPTQLPVVEVRDAKVSINIDVPLYRGQKRDEVAGEEQQQEEQPKDKPPTARPPTPHGKPVSLIEFLWAQAQLNVWHPSFTHRRSYGVIHRRLRDVVANLQIRRHDIAPLFYSPPPYHADREEEIRRGRDAFLAKLAPRGNGRQWYGYVAGLLKAVERTERGGFAIRLAHFALNLHLNSKDWEMLRARWFTDADAPENPPNPVFMLVHVERHEGVKYPWLSVKDIVCLFLSDGESYLPVRSEYERHLARRLVAEQRAFYKPLAVETEGQGSEVPMPSFVLDDRADRMHIEITDDEADGPDANHRRAERQGHYDRLGQPVWWWDVANDPRNPVFPERTLRTVPVSAPSPQIPLDALATVPGNSP